MTAGSQNGSSVGKPTEPTTDPARCTRCGIAEDGSIHGHGPAAANTHAFEGGASVGKPTEPTSEATATVFPQCPSWCTTDSRLAHGVVTEVDDAGQRTIGIEHEGPSFVIDVERSFNTLGVQSNDGSWNLYCYPPGDADPVGPDGARAWATAALAAFEWMGAQR